MAHGDPSSPLPEDVYEDDVAVAVDVADADLDDLGRSQSGTAGQSEESLRVLALLRRGERVRPAVHRRDLLRRERGADHSVRCGDGDEVGVGELAADLHELAGHAPPVAPGAVLVNRREEPVDVALGVDARDGQLGTGACPDPHVEGGGHCHQAAGHVERVRQHGGRGVDSEGPRGGPSAGQGGTVGPVLDDDGCCELGQPRVSGEQHCSFGEIVAESVVWVHDHRVRG